ncbi:hypothetical protein N1236_05470 [Acetivibrio thermocellus]|uniref:hypothetical protein n=1 Tax=Acetivibrio thermocellus TaxID=1515 RepID=UPI0021ADFF8D|nr:hypothetical protein [Acetivibrio thermocellus]UWV48508.1 hypothetical protein N1236_05470 [Acetivibrio thermocellus]
MSKKKYIVRCPHCNHRVFDADYADVEIKCPVCTPPPHPPPPPPPPPAPPPPPHPPPPPPPPPPTPPY